MKFAVYRTKIEVELKNSKYKQDYLRLPFCVDMSKLNEVQLEGLLDKVDKMGAVWIGRKKISDSSGDVVDLIKSAIDNEKRTNIMVYFKDNDGYKENNEAPEILRLSLSDNFMPGSSVYDYETFNELSSNIEASFPLTAKNATTFREVLDKDPEVDLFASY